MASTFIGDTQEIDAHRREDYIGNSATVPGVMTVRETGRCMGLPWGLWTECDPANTLVLDIWTSELCEYEF